MKIQGKLVQRWILVLLLVLMIANLANSVPATAQSTSNDVAASRALALINQWRIENGLAPLIINPSLQSMAEAQALYISPNVDSIEDESAYHKDIQGRTAIQRAVQVYRWPNYGLKDQVEVGENAAHYPADRAVDFWKSSPPHRKAALNATYREVGIAAIPQKPKGSFVFYMTFGARPLELTALIDPITSIIYLTKEQSRYFKSTDLKLTVRFYSHDRQPMTDELPWKASMTLPVGLGTSFFVRYSGYKNPIWIEVDRTRDLAILPTDKELISVSQQLSAVVDFNNRPTTTVVAAQPTATLTSTPVPTATATVTPSRTRISAVATNTPRGIQRTPTPSNTPKSTSTSAPTNTAVAVLPSPTPTTPAPTEIAVTSTPKPDPDLTITYTDRALFITNTARKPISIDGLQVGRLKLENWLRIFQFNTARFPNGYCLQANISGASNDIPPSNCRNVQGQIDALTKPPFWVQGDFDVKMNDKIIQHCVVGAGYCEVYLP